ncbi:MAG TPA: sulfite exporter TauE/SafE family protein [Polyangiales bacterium]|nr:sulfite exporter TauE/SafE family protein [Polyangiales bacterium]
MLLLVLLGLTSLVTATLSAMFGMVGGMLLMGVYAALLPIPAAMVMHGSTQLLSNLSRAFLLRHRVFWSGVWLYVVGAVASFAALYSVHWVPSPFFVFASLGLTPFLAVLLPKHILDFERKPAAVATGSLVAALQLTAGAAGPLLDVAFIDSQMDREQVVATKAVTQCFSHSLKLVYFVPALSSGSIQPELLACVFAATLVGTKLGTLVLKRMTDASFRRYTRAIIYAVGLMYLGKATLLLW